MKRMSVNRESIGRTFWESSCCSNSACVFRTLYYQWRRFNYSRLGHSPRRLLFAHHIRSWYVHCHYKITIEHVLIVLCTEDRPISSFDVSSSHLAVNTSPGNLFLFSNLDLFSPSSLPHCSTLRGHANKFWSMGKVYFSSGMIQKKIASARSEGR